MDRQPAFFRPGGTLEPGAESYIAREADERLLNALVERQYVFLLDSRQKGKSSMVARTIVRLKEAGVRPVKLDLQRIGANVTVEQWYAGLLAGIGQELEQTTELFRYWEGKQALGPLARWLSALEHVVLVNTDRPHVIFIDEVDFVRALPFSTDEFFAGVRDCCNRRSDTPVFANLTFCLVGVTTPAQLIRSQEVTPFNIGLRIGLTDFTVGELSIYQHVLGSTTRDGSSILRRVHFWLDGHPYLTQLVCSQLLALPEISSEAEVDRLIDDMFLAPECRQREPNLVDVERRLLDPDVAGVTIVEKRAEILELYRRVLTGKKVKSDHKDPWIECLKLSGIATESGGQLRVRNRLYEKVFDNRWRRACLPDAEVRRLRGAALRAATSTALVAGLVLSAMAYLLVLLAQTARDRERAMDQLEVRAHQLQIEGYAGLMASIRTQMAAGQWYRVADLVERARSYPGRNWEWGNVYRTMNAQVWKTQLSPRSILFKDPMGALWEASHDGATRIGVTPRNVTPYHLPDDMDPYRTVGPFLICSKLGGSGATCLQLETGRELVRVSGSIVAIDPSRNLLIVRPEPLGTEVEVITIEGKRISSYRGHRSPIRAATFLPNGDCLTTDFGGTYHVWDVSGKTKTHFKTNQEAVGSVVVSPNGRWLTTSGNSYTDIPVLGMDYQSVCSLRGHQAPISTTVFSDSSRFLATGSFDGVVRIFEIPTGKLVHAFVGHKDYIKNIVWGDNDQSLVSLDIGGEVRKWKVGSSADIQTWKDHAVQANSAHLALKGKFLLSAGMDGLVVLRDLSSGAKRELRTEKPGQIPLLTPTGAQEGMLLATSTGALFELSLPGLEPTLRCQMFNGATRKLTASTNGKLVLALGPGSGAYVVRGNALRKALVMGTDLGTIRTFAINSAGSLFALGSEEGEVAIFSALDCKMLGRWSQHKETPVRSLAFSKKYLASGGSDASIVLYDLNSLAITSTLRGHSSRVLQLQFSPDGRTLASASFDGTARLWDVKSGHQKAILSHGSWLSSVRFSPDGARVITASDDHTATIWDTELGYEMITLRGHTQTVWDAFFSANGREVFTVSSDGSVKRWQSAAWR